MIIGYKSSSKSTPIGNKNDNTLVTIDNVSFSKWKEKHEAQIKEEEDRLNNDYYNKYRYIEFDIAGIPYCFSERDYFIIRYIIRHPFYQRAQ